jgi:protein-export membrane protein SecD
MLNQPRWKLWLVVLVCLSGLLAVLPNLVARDTVEAWPDWIPKPRINLGLDLQGGAQLLLEVDVDSLFRERLDSLVNEARAALRAERIGYRDLGVQGGAVRLTLTDPTTRDAALTALRKLDTPVQSAALGFGGTVSELEVTADGAGQVTIRLTEAGLEARRSAALAQALEVVRRRIDELGTREASVQRQGKDRILIQVPGERNPENVKRLLGKTARLTFHMVDLDASPDEVRAGRVPGSMVVESADPSDGMQEYVLRRRIEVSGEDLVDAQPTFQDGQPVVSFRFDASGARKFGKVTTENVGQLFAIVLDGKVISAPRIREPITQGSGIISGNFTVESANELAVLLRAGALPAPMTVIEERSVGPDLGADSIRAGAIASVVAVALVLVFMVVYYGLFGVFACLALGINVILLFGILSALGATLTLPGIAGIVLTIGMAVDSNVLIFERMREEMRAGRSPLAALEAGFSQAMSAIIDANVTTLIAGLVLFEFGTGPVKGFAVTLSIGVVTTMFTAITVTRLIIAAWYRRARPAAVPL